MLTTYTTLQTVYPRMYGETAALPAPDWLVEGLSPHVRGNQAQPEAPMALTRSIPACTGKPGRRTCRARPYQVYPRMYGETSAVTPAVMTG